MGNFLKCSHVFLTNILIKCNGCFSVVVQACQNMTTAKRSDLTSFSSQNNLIFQIIRKFNFMQSSSNTNPSSPTLGYVKKSSSINKAQTNPTITSDLVMFNPSNSNNNYHEISSIALHEELNVSTSNKCKNTGKITFSLINGVLYFMVATAGAASIKSVFNWTGESSNYLLYTVGAFACLTRSTFIYKFLEKPTLLPNTFLGGTLSILSIFSATSFLTAGIVGAELLSIPKAGAIIVGVSEYFLRMINMIDGSVKFPDKFNEIIFAWKYAIQEKDYKEAARLAITIYMTLGICLGNTDAIYTAINTIAHWFGAEESTQLSICSYIGSGLGALGLLPVVFYWGHRGLKQLTFGGRLNEKGINPDPTDNYSYVSILPTLPVLLGMLGTVGPATAANGQVFSKLGLFATVVRFSSAVVYTVCSGTPGMSSFLRGAAPSISYAFSSCKTSIFNAFSSCRRNSIQIDTDPLIA